MSRLLAGALLLGTLISLGARVAADGGLGYEAGLDDDGEWGDDMGYQSDPAYEQYAERLQQQLESLRKEHDEIFGRADTNKVFYSIPFCCCGAFPFVNNGSCRSKHIRVSTRSISVRMCVLWSFLLKIIRTLTARVRAGRGDERG